MNSKYTTDLIIVGTTISASTLQIIKKYRNDSYASIKNDVLNGNSILSCDYVDTEEYEKLLKCYEELLHNNIQVQILENGEHVSRELAYNWLKSMHEIDRYIDNDDSFIEDAD